MLRFNPNGFYIETHQTRFQYILCYGSTLFISPETQGLIEFQYILCYGSTNAVFGRRIYRCNISIHLMLRFNEFATFGKKIDDKFQYILCYGSTMSLLFLMKHSEHFNTSYVTVQHLNLIIQVNFPRFQYILCYGSTKYIVLHLYILVEFQYILCYGSTGCVNEYDKSAKISIHLMLRFNGISRIRKMVYCYISIHLMLRFNSCTYAFYISHHIK